MLGNDNVWTIRSATGTVKKAGLDHKRSIPHAHHSLQTKIADRRSCAAAKNLNMNRISSEGSAGVYRVLLLLIVVMDVQSSSFMGGQSSLE